MHVPDLAAAPTLPGAGLADGTVSASVLALAMPGLDLGSFLFTDVVREHRAYAGTAPIEFSKP